MGDEKKEGTLNNGNAADESGGKKATESSIGTRKLVLRVHDDDDDDWADDFSWGDEISSEATEDVEDNIIGISSYSAAPSASQPSLAKPKLVPSLPLRKDQSTPVISTPSGGGSARKPSRAPSFSSALVEQFFATAEIGDEAKLFELIGINSVDLDNPIDLIRDKQGRTLLHCAAQHGHFGIAAHLAVYGMKLDTQLPTDDRYCSLKEIINSTDHNGCTPLHYACSGKTSSHFRTAQCLIHMGANVNATTSNKDTPMHVLVRSSIETKVVTREDAAPLVYSSAPMPSISPIPQVVQPTSASKDPNNSSWFVGTKAIVTDPLGLREVMLLLYTRGADLNAKNAYGRTPLHEACASGLEQCSLFLIVRGADASILDSNGEQPLHLALRCGLLSTIGHLVMKGHAEELQKLEVSREATARNTEVLEQLATVLERRKEMKYFVFPEIVDRRYVMGDLTCCYARPDIRNKPLAPWKEVIRAAKPLDDHRVAVELTSRRRVWVRRLRPFEEERARLDVAIRRNTHHNNLMKILDVALDNGLSLMNSSDRTSSPSLRLSASSIASPRSQPSFNSLPPLPAQNSATNSGAGNLASSIWLVNEYFDGCKLHDYIRLRGRLDEDEARAIFLQVVSAVLYAHRLHMLYRELLVDCIPYLKPENIYLSFSKMSTTHVLAPVSSMNAKVASKERKPRRQAQAPSSSAPLTKRDQPHASSSNSTGTILNPPAALSARTGPTQSTKHARHRSIPSLAAILQLSPTAGSSATIPSTPANSGATTNPNPAPPTGGSASRSCPVVKVGLYGFSKSLHPSAMSTSYFAYAAPEVAAGSYGHNHANGQLIDSWTCGVLLYIMITGSFPFAGEDDEEHHQFITKGKWSANDPYLNVSSSSNLNLSSSGTGSGISTPKPHDSNALKDLLSQLLTPIPSDRLHLSAAIKHPWCLMASENSTAVPLVASSSLYSSSTEEMSSSASNSTAATTTSSGKGGAATTTISFSPDVSQPN
eukprot:TRINITY_DN5758_c0_g1_i1.p1 TRINITY_DN5758_c0_g1~~TRINITY_DN5758_c0_g1_i1.p1  ORF type:complete len:991 (+),score=244.84 TRINITY_DN5758_c0_g1_i1:31-3003(+)